MIDTHEDVGTLQCICNDCIEPPDMFWMSVNQDTDLTEDDQEEVYEEEEEEEFDHELFQAIEIKR